MVDRYEILKYIQNDIHYRDWQIKITKGAITQDNLKDNLLLQFKLQNISDKIITNIDMSIDCYDESGKKVSERIRHNYRLSGVYPGELFGDDIPIVLVSKNTKKVKIFLDKIVFDDFSFIEYIDNQIQNNLNSTQANNSYTPNNQYKHDENIKDVDYENSNENQAEDDQRLNLENDRYKINNISYVSDKYEELRYNINNSKSNSGYKKLKWVAVSVLGILLIMFLFGSCSVREDTERNNKLDHFIQTF